MKRLRLREEKGPSPQGSSLDRVPAVHNISRGSQECLFLFKLEEKLIFEVKVYIHLHTKAIINTVFKFFFNRKKKSS